MQAAPVMSRTDIQVETCPLCGSLGHGPMGCFLEDASELTEVITWQAKHPHPEAWAPGEEDKTTALVHQVVQGDAELVDGLTESEETGSKPRLGRRQMIKWLSLSANRILDSCDPNQRARLLRAWRQAHKREVLRAATRKAKKTEAERIRELTELTLKEGVKPFDPGFPHSPRVDEDPEGTKTKTADQEWFLSAKQERTARLRDARLTPPVVGPGTDGGSH